MGLIRSRVNFKIYGARFVSPFVAHHHALEPCMLSHLLMTLIMRHIDRYMKSWQREKLRDTILSAVEVSVRCRNTSSIESIKGGF
jgi:hypothetical protein